MRQRSGRAGLRLMTMIRRIIDGCTTFDRDNTAEIEA
jgi:hypothetical protein